MKAYKSLIDRYYPEGSPLRDIFLRHSRAVTALALEIADRLHLPLENEMIEEAAMLHDIGIFLTDAPGIHCHGTVPYIAHGYLGADLLRREHFSEETARVAERHTGSGITPTDIAAQHLPLPSDRSYMPESLLERLICYADKFYSKSGDMKRKSLDRVKASQARISEATLQRFERLHDEFGRSSDIPRN